VNRHSLYEKTVLRRGCTIGANATIVCGVTVGRYAFIAAGTVVTKDVADYALMVGVPARRQGWMSRHGHRLVDKDGSGLMVCPESGLRYQLTGAALKCLDIDEEEPLPAPLTVGKVSFSELKRKGSLA
jgi:UDP-2-acetamido-3-amino-2,3-dideoxy-glucuronate N-acetyltransferase